MKAPLWFLGMTVASFFFMPFLVTLLFCCFGLIAFSGFFTGLFLLLLSDVLFSVTGSPMLLFGVTGYFLPTLLGIIFFYLGKLIRQFLWQQSARSLS